MNNQEYTVIVIWHVFEFCSLLVWKLWKIPASIFSFLSFSDSNMCGSNVPITCQPHSLNYLSHPFILSKRETFCIIIQISYDDVRGSGYIALHITHRTEHSWVDSFASWMLYPQGRSSLYLFNIGLGGLQRWSGCNKETNPCTLEELNPSCLVV
jgi:hypothetical protein